MQNEKVGHHILPENLMEYCTNSMLPENNNFKQTVHKSKILHTLSDAAKLAPHIQDMILDAGRPSHMNCKNDDECDGDDNTCEMDALLGFKVCQCKEPNWTSDKGKCVCAFGYEGADCVKGW